MIFLLALLLAVSPENTRVPPASEIFDSVGGWWTLDTAGEPGQQYPAIQANQIAYCGDVVYARGLNGIWQRAQSDFTWVTLTSLDPCPPLPPPTGTDQMGCKPATATTQSCSVTVSWTDSVNPAGTTYLVQRRDGGGPWADVGSTALLSLINQFTDGGNITHCWQAFALNASGKSGPSNVACWTTPALGPSYPTVPPNANISQAAAPIIWTLGKPSAEFPGNYDILRNGQSVYGARGSKIALCNAQIFVVGRDKLWWSFTGGAWVQTGSAKLPCD